MLHDAVGKLHLEGGKNREKEQSEISCYIGGDKNEVGCCQSGGVGGMEWSWLVQGRSLSGSGKGKKINKPD